jgi:glycosyltransferase involved in cell wall biosynthesis
MRITIDARMMSPGVTRGIGRYIEELVKAMAVEESEHQFTIIVRRKSSEVPVNVTQVIVDILWYGVAEQLKMPGVIAATRPDLVHVPHWNVPIFSRVPRVVTIHDLLLLSEPASAKITTRGPAVAWIKRMGHRFVLQRALFGSQMILVPTQYVAGDIRRHFPSLKTPIVVTGEGMPMVDEQKWSEPAAEKPYLLYVGSAYPHKGLDLLLDAWRELSAHHPQLSLVLAGERDVFMKRLEGRVAREHLPRVQFPGRVSEAELPGLYAKATAFVFPSRQEGFGLPPLEAMAYGCPVISADSTCLPEVLGTQGVTFFRTGDSGDILRAIGTVLQDPQGFRIAARTAVVGLAKRHSWKDAAGTTLKAYQTVRDSYAHPPTLSP